MTDHLEIEVTNEPTPRQSLDDTTGSDRSQEELDDVEFGDVDLASPQEEGNPEPLPTGDRFQDGAGHEMQRSVSTASSVASQRRSASFITRTSSTLSTHMLTDNAPINTTFIPSQIITVTESDPEPIDGTRTTVESESFDTMEPVSLDEEASFNSGLTPKPNKTQHSTNSTSPSLGSKLNLSSAFGYAASLLPSQSPSKPNENATAGPSRSSSSTSLTPMAQQDTFSLDSAKPPPSASWTSSISSYFVSKPPAPPRPTNDRKLTNSTAFLLHNLDATKEARRHSVEAGGSDALREEFEKVKRDSARLRDAAAFGDIGEFEEEDSEDNSQALEMKSKEREKPTRNEQDYIDGQEPELGPDGVDWPFWGCVMNDYEGIARARPKDLSRAIQLGIPAVVRGTIWQLMSSSKNVALEATYAGLLKDKSPHEKAIQKDLARTLPGHRYFAQGGGVGQENLFNVVKAYSLYDTEVGYTQGVAFVVASLLLNMPDEEAFCVLVRLMDSYNLRTHYLPEMPGLQLRMFQFERLLEELLPVLHLHFVRKGVKSSMYASTWFLTLFSHRFPLSLVYRIFDIVFAEGIEAIFRFSLALMRRNEERLLSLEFEGILKFLGNEVFDCYKTETTTSDNDALHADDDADWLANEFVKDAYATPITPFMLDSYGHEWEELCRVANAHATEMDTLRNQNRVLSAQVKQLEGAMAAMSEEHVEMVKQLVEARIEREAMESELIRYKTLYAELMHEQDTSRASYIAPSQRDKSTTSQTREVQSVPTAPIAQKFNIASTTTATFHLTLMREALSYSYLCEVSPTAFSVGSIIFLPRSASISLFDVLSASFAAVDREGLILSQGYSRQLPGNTHAEANAIHNFVGQLHSLPANIVSEIGKVAGLPEKASLDDLAQIILGKCWIYATMEPCSKRTSGLRDCTAEIIHWGLTRVYMGVREPLDYVECEGLRILREAGVEVVSVQGMEEECLAAARRGL